MDDATPEQQASWTNKKHIVHEEDVVATLSSVLIGADTLLRDNPLSYPVQDGKGLCDARAISVAIAVPVSAAE